MSEWRTDLEAVTGTDPAPFHPAPVPERGPDPVVRLEGGQEASSLSLATEGEAQERPRRHRKRVAPAGEVAKALAGTDTDETVPALSDVFVTVDQMAALLHWHRGSARRAIYQGRITAFKVGNRILIPADDLMDYIERGRLYPRAWAVRRSRGQEARHGQA